MQKKQIRKKEIKELNDKISKFSVSIDIKDKVELVDEDHKGKKEKFVFVEENPWFYYHEERFMPVLKIIDKVQIPKVVVDMGAIKFVVSGADIMRPGIVDIEEFGKDDFILVVDENNKKPLAVGTAMMSSEEMKNADSGKVVKNVHYVGDWIWDL